MKEKRLSLTDAEWNVMECLWAHSPRTGRELTEALGESCGWNRSTTLTLLRRLEAKGAVASSGETGIKTFRPLVSREDAALGETESLLSRVYRGSLSLLVRGLVIQSVMNFMFFILHAFSHRLEHLVSESVISQS